MIDWNGIGRPGDSSDGVGGMDFRNIHTCIIAVALCLECEILDMENG